LALVITSFITLGIMAIYLLNLPETASRTNFWVTLLVAVWVILNLGFEFKDLSKRQHTKGL
jgi:hypothetical protein